MLPSDVKGDVKVKAKTTTRPKAKAKAKPPRTRLDVDERRAQLIALAIAEFASRPYDEVSIDAIAQGAGISKGLVYHYFPTKRALYIACVREGASDLVARIEVPVDAPPIEQLRAGIDRYLDYVKAHGLAFAALMRSGVGADREITEIIDETRAVLLGFLTTGLSEVFPAAKPTRGSLLDIALRGWIGLAESASIAWVEAVLRDKERDKDREKTGAASAIELREVLVEALIAIVGGVTTRMSV